MSMTFEQAKSELMQIYGALSPDKQRAIDTLVKIEPCEDAISRQAVINLIRRCNSALEEPRIFESHHSGNIFEHYITKLPSVNPQEPKTGRWIENAPEYQNIDPPYICSECGHSNLIKTNYCEQCGARMAESEG